MNSWNSLDKRLEGNWTTLNPSIHRSAVQSNYDVHFAIDSRRAHVNVTSGVGEGVNESDMWLGRGGTLENKVVCHCDKLLNSWICHLNCTWILCHCPNRSSVCTICLLMLSGTNWMWVTVVHTLHWQKLSWQGGWPHISDWRRIRLACY